MAENEEGKPSVSERVEDGVQKTKKTIKTINRIKNIFAIPVLGHILMAIVAIIILAFIFVGVWNFFTAMPNMVRDKLAKLVRNNRKLVYI